MYPCMLVPTTNFQIPTKNYNVGARNNGSTSDIEHQLLLGNNNSNGVTTTTTSSTTQIDGDENCMVTVLSASRHQPATANSLDQRNDPQSSTVLLPREVRQLKKSRKTVRAAIAAATKAERGIQEQLKVLKQICNLLLFFMVAETSVHTMLGFALRQEILRKEEGAQSISLVSWLIAAQICIATSWLYQLLHRYSLYTPKRSNKTTTATTAAVEMQQTQTIVLTSSYSWTFLREYFWLFALVFTICELLAYINCNTWPQSSSSSSSSNKPSTCSTMLRILISIRLALNLLLVVAATHGLSLQRKCNQTMLKVVNWQKQQLQRNHAIVSGCASHATISSLLVHPTENTNNGDDVNDDGTNTTAPMSPVPAAAVTGKLVSGDNPVLHSSLDITAMGSSGNDAHLPSSLIRGISQEQITPMMAAGVASYGAIAHNSNSFVGTSSIPSQQQETDGNESTDTDNNDDDSQDALTSGVKKVRMYHQSDELSHDMVGLRDRLRLLLPFLWPSEDRILQLRILGCFFILIAGRIVNVLVPLQFKIVIDGLTPKDGKSPKFEWQHILLYVFLCALQGTVGILSTWQSFMWIPVGQATTKRISVAMFEHLHKLSLRFHVGRKTGEILRVQDRGVTSVVSLLSSILFNVIPTLFDIALACYFFSVMFDLYFGTIVLTTMSSYLATTILLTGWRSRYRRLSNYLDNEMEARAVDSLLNFETVKFYNAERFECKEYTSTVDEFQVAEWMSNATMSLLNLGQNFIVQFGLLAGALLSAKRVSEGEMTVGDFTMLLTYITQLYAPLNWFGTYYRVIQKNFIDMEKLLELFDEPIELQDPKVPVPLSVTKGEVSFENVSFAYDKQLTLKNISFKVPEGSTVAIVGPSGSGKSTILRLLFRFYDVHSGRITIDGQDIRSVPQFDLRQAIGVVPQDTVLFNDSIRYNIAYGRAGGSRGVSMGEVFHAADAAHIHSRINGFPEQYETRVGERGQRLSGGEKQRVAIARTLLKDPKIVCLDEATSALDTATERQIQSSLRDMTRNRTTLIIAHRLSTIVHADQILIVNNGEIVERGTHTELMANKESMYHDMWMKQLADAANNKNLSSYDHEMLDTHSSDMEVASRSEPDSLSPEISISPEPKPISHYQHYRQLSLQAPEQETVNSMGRPNRQKWADKRHGLNLVLGKGTASMPSSNQPQQQSQQQGWVTRGPLTAPLPVMEGDNDNIFHIASSPSSSSSSLSGGHLDVSTLSNGVGAATAATNIPFVNRHPGESLLLEEIGVSPFNVPFNRSNNDNGKKQVEEEDHDHLSPHV